MRDEPAGLISPRAGRTLRFAALWAAAQLAALLPLLLLVAFTVVATGNARSRAALLG